MQGGNTLNPNPLKGETELIPQPFPQLNINWKYSLSNWKVH